MSGHVEVSEEGNHEPPFCLDRMSRRIASGK